MKRRYVYGPTGEVLFDQVFDTTVTTPLQGEQDLVLPLGGHQHSTRVVLAHDFQDATYVRQSLDYAQFGRVTATLGAGGPADSTGVVTAFAHHGSLLDAATGLQLKGQRWYSVDLGRFVSEDPIQDGANWYMFAGNDPVNYADPSGLCQQGHPLTGGSNFSRLPASTTFGGFVDANQGRQILGYEPVSTPTVAARPTAIDSFNRQLSAVTNASALNAIAKSTRPDYSFKTDPAYAAIREYEYNQSRAAYQRMIGAELADISARSAVRNRESVHAFGETWVMPWNSRASGIGDTATAYAYATGRAFAGTASGAATGAGTRAAS